MSAIARLNDANFVVNDDCFDSFVIVVVVVFFSDKIGLLAIIPSPDSIVVVDICCFCENKVEKFLSTCLLDTTVVFVGVLKADTAYFDDDDNDDGDDDINCWATNTVNKSLDSAVTVVILERYILSLVGEDKLVYFTFNETLLYKADEVSYYCSDVYSRPF